MHYSGTMDADELVGLQRVLEALELLGDELANRTTEDLAFRVTVQDDIPSVGLLAELINRIGMDWEERTHREEIRNRDRANELSLAYEALQSRNDQTQRDMEAARRVQLQLLPQESELPQREEIEFAGFYQSKDRVGGDLYDFIRIGMNSWGFLVADVSGHGVPSALLTMFLKAAFRTRVRWGVASDQVCREVNAVLNPLVGDLGLFVTAFFGILDLETATFRYSNCGHPPVFLHRAATGTLVQLEERGMILGPFDEIEVTQDEILLQEGDFLLSVTDGILEAKNFREEMYGPERLIDALLRFAPRRDDPQASVGATLGSIRRDWEGFITGSTPDDDLTLAAFRFLHRTPEKGGITGGSDFVEDRVRRDRLLVAGLRRKAREAYAQGRWNQACALVEALLALDAVGAQDRLLGALIARKQGRPDDARRLAERALEGLAPGSTRDRLARKILDGR